MPTWASRPSKALLAVATLLLAGAATDRVAPGYRTAWCRGEASRMYDTNPRHVTTGPLLRARDGSTSVSGMADKGREGLKRFKCRFDRAGGFLGVMATTPDGE